MPEHLEEIEYEGLSPNAGLGVRFPESYGAKEYSTDTEDVTGQHGCRSSGKSPAKQISQDQWQSEIGPVAMGGLKSDFPGWYHRTCGHVSRGQHKSACFRPLPQYFYDVPDHELVLYVRGVKPYRLACKCSRRRQQRCTQESGTRSRGYHRRRVCAPSGAGFHP